MKFKLIILAFVIGLSSLSYAGDQIVLKLKPAKSNSSKFIAESGGPTKMNQLSVKQIKYLSNIAGYKIQSVRPIASGAQVIKFDSNLTKTQMQMVITNLKADSSVEYVVEDRRLQHMQNQPQDVQ